MELRRNPSEHSGSKVLADNLIPALNALIWLRIYQEIDALHKDTPETDSNF